MSRSSLKSLLLCLALALPAAAAPNNTDKARAAFQAAQALYEASKYADALKKFEEAQALKAHPVIVFNIARCHEQLGDVQQALDAYREYLKQLPTATDKDAVKASIAALEKKLPKAGLQQVVVAVEPANATVKVDGKTLTGSPPSASLPDGEHALEVTAEGYDTLKRSFTLSGKPLEMNIALRAALVADAPKKDPSLTLTPPPTPPLVVTEPAPTRSRTGTWITAGVAVVAAGTATGLALGASSNAQQLKDGTIRNQDDATRLAEGATGMALGSAIAWGVAGAAAVTAVILFFVEGAPAPAK